MATATPKLALRPFLPTDAPLLAEIFRESVLELTADDYSEAQQQAWISRVDDLEVFAGRLGKQLTLIATLEGSPVAFASLAGNTKIDMLFVHPAAAGQGAAALLVDALEKLAGARGAEKLTVTPATPRAVSSRSAVTPRSSAIRSRSATNGWPTPPCPKRLWPNRRRRNCHEEARHAVPAALAVLHRPQGRGDRRGGGAGDQVFRIVVVREGCAS